MVTIKRIDGILRGIRGVLESVPKGALWALSALELWIILAFAVAWQPRHEDAPPAVTRTEPAVATGTAMADCAPTIEAYTVRWASMEPMIRDGAELTVDKSHYRCGNAVARGDVVIYESSATKGAVVKRVRAVPGDGVTVKDGTLSVNGEVLANSAWTPYRFSPAESLMLSIYAPDGKLQEGAYLVFGDNVGNSTDSRKYGAVRAKDFVGRVVPPK